MTPLLTIRGGDVSPDLVKRLRALDESRASRPIVFDSLGEEVGRVDCDVRCAHSAP